MVISSGADKLAKDYAQEKKIEYKEFSAQWNLYGKSAGPKRNTEIVNLCTYIIAFPSRKGRGTQDSIRKVEKKVFL